MPNATLSITDRLQFGFLKKLPAYRQTESAECGLACLAMIAAYHGHNIDVPNLRKYFTVSQKGATLPQLIEIANWLKLASRPVRLDLEEIDQLQAPCILHWNLDHFVVLKCVTRKKIIIHDPARGVCQYSLAQASQYFTGVALELTPTPGFRPRSERVRVDLRSMLGKVIGLKRSLAQIIGLALTLEAFSLITPLFNQIIVDKAVEAGDIELLYTLVLGFIVLQTISVLIEMTKNWALTIMGTNVNVQWLANLFHHLLRLPVGYFEKRHIGDIVSRFNSVNSIQSTLTTSFLSATLDGVMAVGNLAMMLIYSTQLSGVTVICIILYIGLRSAFYASLMGATQSEIVADAKQQSLFLETVRGIQPIRLFAKGVERGALWLNSLIEKKNANLRTQRLNTMFESGNKFLFGVETAIVTGLGAKMVIENTFSIGMLFAFLSYKNEFFKRFANLTDRVFDFRLLKYQMERLSDIALTPPEADMGFGVDLANTDLPLDIQVRNVTFSYGAGEKPVLVNVNLEVSAGEFVAIVGPSGCGKSTLLKILLGIHKPVVGEIRVAGIPLDQVGLSNYRKVIGVVLQDDVLFAGSIMENISFFSPDTDQEQVELSAKMACVHNEIMAMPMGYHTLVGDMGSALSGGQKQRLLLARALYKRPRIIFMDEATSHLDIQNEKNINEIINKLSITRVTIAHRPETIASADRVIVLGEGSSASMTMPKKEVAPANL